MKTIFKLAWRNIWRNKRRTLITVASIAFALLFANLMRGLQTGSYIKMKENAIESYSGYLQIQHQDYWDDKNIENIFSIDSATLNKIKQTKGVSAMMPRLESFALASTGEVTKGAMIMGIDPQEEDTMTQVSSYLDSGTYLDSKDNSVLLGSGLAKFLKLSINDTLVLFSSGYHGATAAGLYPVKGILSLPTPEMDKNTIYMTIGQAQEFFSTGNQFTALAIDVEDMNEVAQIKTRLENQIDSKSLTILPWETMNRELLQMIESDNAGGIIMVGILYMVIAFGIFGTVLMMTNERIREFSVMISVGMQKSKLAIVVMTELVLLTLIAVIAGFIVSTPFIIYLYYNPIRFSGKLLDAMKDFNIEPVMPMNVEPEVFLMQALSISIISIIAMSYPIGKIFKLDVVNGLRG